MKRFVLLLVTMLLFVVSFAFGADTAAVVPVATAGEPSVLAWFSVNKAYIFGALLAISELFGVIPQFKGNGILDAVIKALKLLTGKDQQAA